MKADAGKLILVYNADSGLIEALMHAVHKQFRPSTYPCSLCALTYGAVSMRGDWRRYLESLGRELVFHHRDDFTEAYPALGTGGARELALPVILASENGEEPCIILSASELDGLPDIEALMSALSQKLDHNASATPSSG